MEVPGIQFSAVHDDHDGFFVRAFTEYLLHTFVHFWSRLFIFSLDVIYKPSMKQNTEELEAVCQSFLGYFRSPVPGVLYVQLLELFSCEVLVKNIVAVEIA